MSGCTSTGTTSTPPQQIVYVTVLVTPTPAPIITPVTIPTVAPPSVNIRSSGNSGWVQFTSYEDHFSIYRPSNWEVKTLDTADVYRGASFDYSQFFDKMVYIYTPNLKGFIMIYGLDFSGTLYSLYNDQAKTQISDELYDDFVQGIKLGETDQLKVISTVKDSNNYQINGNPARRVTVNSQSGGESLNGDFYLIAHKNSYYIEGYFAMAGSTASDASTATNIMRTFSTTT